MRFAVWLTGAAGPLAQKRGFCLPYFAAFPEIAINEDLLVIKIEKETIDERFRKSGSDDASVFSSA